MAPANARLVYFNGRGRAEQLRWILVHAGAKWEDKRIEQEDWPALKPKTPAGSLPYLDADGFMIGSSGAAALYLAREYKLIGSNNLEAAQIHMMWECTQDTFNAGVKAMFCKDKDEQANLFKEYFSQTVPKLVKLMATHLKGGKDWLVGNQVSMADLVTVCLLHGITEEAGLMAINAEPAVKAHVAKVTELPNIKKWIATRPESAF